MLCQFMKTLHRCERLRNVSMFMGLMQCVEAQAVTGYAANVVYLGICEAGSQTAAGCAGGRAWLSAAECRPPPSP